MEVKLYTREDFLSTTKPYVFLLEKEKDPSEYAEALNKIRENAYGVGVKSFNKLYSLFKEDVSRDQTTGFPSSSK